MQVFSIKHRFVSLMAFAIILMMVIFSKSRKQFPYDKLEYDIPETDISMCFIEYSRNYLELFIYHQGQEGDYNNDVVFRKDIEEDQALIVINPSKTDTVFVGRDFDILQSYDITLLHLADGFSPSSDSYDGYDLLCLFDAKDGKLFCQNESGLSEISTRTSFYEQHAKMYRDLLSFATLFLIGLIGYLVVLLRDRKAESNRIRPIFLLDNYQMPKELYPHGEKIIRIANIDYPLLKNTLDDFLNDTGLTHIKAEVKDFGEYKMVKMSESITFRDFALLVNYLRYCNQRQKYSVIGWYKMGENTHDTPRITLSGKLIMMYVPDYDVEFDNVYFMTDSEHHFKWSFGDEEFIEVKNEECQYIPLPPIY